MMRGGTPPLFRFCFYSTCKNFCCRERKEKKNGSGGGAAPTVNGAFTVLTFSFALALALALIKFASFASTFST